MKGQGWTSVVVRPIAQINELIGEIKDKQEKHALSVSKSDDKISNSTSRKIKMGSQKTVFPSSSKGEVEKK